jgi:myo-inositol-1-phosphate synthase
LSDQRLGVWMVGALGGIGTTLVVGARAIARGLVGDTGLVTSRPGLAALDLVPVGQLVFGGHEVRQGTLPENARQIAKGSGSLDTGLIGELEDELLALGAALRPGTCLNAGDAIRELVTDDRATAEESPQAVVERLRRDLREFREREDLQRVVVVNLSSTEPDLPPEDEPADLAALEELLAHGDGQRVRPSMLYTLAAFLENCAYINFTPSQAALGAALQGLGRQRGLPFMGNDGKTGETLVKSALAPMFKARNLRVLSWQGYNMLGDRDGQILAHDENLASKVRSKDAVLQAILGYPLHTHVGIDFVPSLDDRKTAWDFIHFQGFLGHGMSMQFVWQGCDAILAAPLVLDMVRLADLALRRGESGPMPQLACFFKSPLHVTEHDLHRQYEALAAYLRERGGEPS